MKRPRPDLIGIDFNRILKAGAADMLRQAEEGEKASRAKAERYEYTQVPEVCVMTFQERVDPPMWRMETLQPGPNGMGIVKVWDPEEQFLEAELRNKLAGLLEVYDVCKNSAEARGSAARITFRNVGRVPLKDSQTREGDRF